MIYYWTEIIVIQCWIYNDEQDEDMMNHHYKSNIELSSAKSIP